MRALVVIAASILAGSASAADYYAVVDNLGRRPLNAWLDVAVDEASGNGGPPEVLFTAWDAQGAQLAEFIALAQVGFASSFSSGNLFDLSSGQQMLVRARTLSTAADSGAALHVELRGVHIMTGVPHITEADGTPYASGRLFAVPLGGFKKASLLIANISFSDVSVESFRGVKEADGSGVPLNSRLQTHGSFRVDLTQSDAFSNYIVNSSGPIIVQVVIDDGKTVQSYMAPPSR